MLNVKEGDAFVNVFDDELTVREVLAVDDEDDTCIVLADDGQKYVLEWTGDALVGIEVDEEEE